MFPNYETVLKYCDQYKRVPVSMELYADQFTPIELLRILRQASNHCYLLESAVRMNNGAVIPFWDTILLTKLLVLIIC